MEFSYSSIPHCKAMVHQVRAATTTWHEWATAIVAAGHPARALKDGLLLSPCLWPANAPTREKAHALDSGALVIDIDGEGERTMEGVKALAIKLESKGLSFLIHSTHSHCTATPSFRIWVPLSRRVLKVDWLKFWLHGIAYLGAQELRDNSCKDVGRWYYAPATTPGQEPVMFYKPGGALDVDAVWATPAPAYVAPLQTGAPVDKAKLKDVLKKLKRKDGRERDVEQIQNVIDGEMICADEHGSRHATFLSLTHTLACYLTDVDPEEMGKLFGPTLSRYEDQSRFTPDYVAKMFRTSQEKWHSLRQEQQVEIIEKQVVSIKQATDGKRETPYRGEEVAAWATSMGVAPDDMKHLWILQKGNGYLTLVEGRYKGPYTRDEAGAAIHRDLVPACDVGVSLYIEAKNGTKSRKSATDLVIDYGTVIENIQYSFLQETSTYNAEKRILTIASAPKAGLSAQFHQGVADYLKVLGGEQHDLLLQWIARVPDLSLPLPILALIGAKRAAKSGFAHGLAKFWEHGRCTELEAAMSKFNADMKHSPLVFADEVLPVDAKGRPRTRDLRKFMQERARDIEAKFLPRMTLLGCTRTILSANSTTVVEGEDRLDSKDVDAIAERFLYIEVTDQVSAFIDDIGHSEFRAWVECGVFARHMLYLNQTVPMPMNPGRYILNSEGSSKLAQTMATGTSLGSFAAEWVYRFLSEPEKLYSHSHDPRVETVHVQNGILYVTAPVMGDYFDTYCKGMSRPSVKNVSHGLDSIARAAPVNVKLPLSGKRTKCRAVDASALETWARNAQLDFDCAALMEKAEKAMARVLETKKAVQH